MRGGIGLASTPDTEMGMIGDPLTTSDVLARGIHLAVGIDTTCYVGADLFAVTRGLMLEMRRQRVEFTARQGLELLTVGAANAVGEAANLGTLTPGKRGDLVVVRPDPARARSRRCCSTAGRAMSISC